MARFSGKTVVITGAGSGIGAATARRFGAEGAEVVLIDLSLEAAQAVARDIPGSMPLGCDVADQDAVNAAIERVAETFGSIDVLFNNAGIANQLHATPDTPADEWLRIVAVNLNSIFYMCRAAIPHMRGRGGAIINTSSVAGLGGDRGCHAYSATKAAVINYTRTLAIDHGADGIRVNAVCPGPIATAMTAGLFAVPQLVAMTNEAIPLGRYGEPEDIASAVAFLASDDAAFMTGVIVPVDGGLSCGSGNPDIGRAYAKMLASQEA
ncbi:SDR family NAD(P)-dependent oxidoreductase [Novosphingobium sp.]|uniref:SDR family NAD(P)-dependent oxidoreductase n=1 Tax=Novosphingobium sp. TaxID=1874826 RepID=UPI003BAA5EDB